MTLLITFVSAFIVAYSYNKYDRVRRRLRAMRRQHADLSILHDNGEWVATHQGIAFDTNGYLIDGQHRLTALATSKVASIVMLVSHGCDPKSFLVADTNKPRTQTQRLFMAGVDIDGPRMAVLNRIVRGTNSGQPRISGDINKQQVILQKYQDALNFVRDVLPFGKCRSGGDLALRAVVGRAFINNVDLQTLIDFCHSVHANDPLPDRPWAPVREVVKLLAASKHSRAKCDDVDVYRRCECALRAYAQNRVVVKLMSLDHEIYPIDEDAEAT